MFPRQQTSGKLRAHTGAVIKMLKMGKPVLFLFLGLQKPVYKTLVFRLHQTISSATPGDDIKMNQTEHTVLCSKWALILPHVSEAWTATMRCSTNPWCVMAELGTHSRHQHRIASVTRRNASLHGRISDGPEILRPGDQLQHQHQSLPSKRAVVLTLSANFKTCE